MKYWALGHRLPRFITSLLFGDRQLYGKHIDHEDEDWKKWQNFCLQFYNDTQKSSVGNIVNRAGYGILSKLSLTGMHVAEIGPGILPHMEFWQGKPESYSIFDIRQEMLESTEAILKAHNIETRAFLVTSERLPCENELFDIVISFYNLEHLNPLEQYLDEIARILRPGGLLVGAIPGEGGLAWGLGRLLTSRRYMKKKSPINYDKIVCWEHPNFADQILAECDKRFKEQLVSFWPLGVNSLDLNLVIKFIYQINK